MFYRRHIDGRRTEHPKSESSLQDNFDCCFILDVCFLIHSFLFYSNINVSTSLQITKISNIVNWNDGFIADLMRIIAHAQGPSVDVSPWYIAVLRATSPWYTFVLRAASPVVL